MANDPNDTQIGGNHYQRYTIQLWDIIHQFQIPYLYACVLKYVERYDQKNGYQDLQKAIHYLQKIESEQATIAQHKICGADSFRISAYLVERPAAVRPILNMVLRGRTLKAKKAIDEVVRIKYNVNTPIKIIEG